MSSSVKKKFIDLIETMLTAMHLEEGALDEDLLEPLRAYIHDIERFSTHKVIDSKFRAFVKTRDEQMLAMAGKPLPATNEDLERGRKAINLILDQVLNLLENGIHTSEELAVDLKEVMEKVYEAKTINNVRALSQSFVDLGGQMLAHHQTFQSGLSNLAVELSYCKHQIRDLEGQLAASRWEAERDHLTGLRNRRIFDEDLHVAVERGHRFKGELCLLLLDLDQFRDINEKWGHQAGDDVLVNFAKLLERSLREFDLTYRLGGDDFAVLFTGCPSEKAYAVAERVRAYVSGHVYQVADAQFSTTVSGGVSVLQRLEDSNSFFDRADHQLRRAKQAGGNRIILSVPED